MNTVFFDVDTQLDFLSPAGSLYVPGAEHIERKLRALTHFAAERNVTIVSTMDAHTENDPEFRTWKPHCVAGTQSQQKCSATLLKKVALISTTAVTIEGLTREVSGSPQIVVEKQQIDPFSNPNLAALLDVLSADRYVVYGLVTEHCVAAVVFGLLVCGSRVDLVVDAIRSLDEAAERTMLARFQGQGGRLLTVNDVV